MLEETFAIFVLFFLGGLGTLIHLTVLILKFKLKSMKQHFYTFVSVLNCSNVLNLLIFMFWCAPCIIYHIPADKFVRSHVPGFIMCISWNISTHILLSISFSRFLAVFYPTKFVSESDNFIKYSLLTTMILALISSVPLMIPPCSFYFDYNLFLYHMGLDDCSYYFDKIYLTYDTISLTLSMTFSWATYFKVVHD